VRRNQLHSEAAWLVVIARPRRRGKFVALEDEWLRLAKQAEMLRSDVAL
jgi:hypothetical protein